MKQHRFPVAVALLSAFWPTLLPAQLNFEDKWLPKEAIVPAYHNERMSSSPAGCELLVDMGDTLNDQVSPFIYGNNICWYHHALTDHARDPEHTFYQHARDLSPNILRWPGGNGSNIYFWDGNIPDYLDFTTWSGAGGGWWVSLDEYYKSLEYSNSTGIICVNYGYARYGRDEDPVATAAGYAADWVRYDNGRTRYWELGNENYGSWVEGYEIDTTHNQDGQPRIQTGDLYGQHALVFLDSMRAAAAEIGVEIEIGLVLHPDVGHTEVMKNWNQGVITHAGATADYSIIHSYYTPHNKNSPPDVILDSYDQTEGYLEHVDQVFLDAGLEPLPYAMTEYNIFAKGSAQQISQINALHAVLVLGELAELDFLVGTRWDLANGYNNGDDHGMFTKDHPGVANNVPYADFFHMYFFQRFFGDKVVATGQTGNADIVARASAFASGEAGIVLVNKGESDEVVELGFEDFDMQGRFYWYLIEGDGEGDFPARIRINGESAPEGRFGPANYKELRARSAMQQDGKLRIALPAHTAAYILAEKDSPPSITSAVAGLKQDKLGLSFSEAIQEPTGIEGFFVMTGDDQIDTISSFSWEPSDPDSLVLLLNKEIGPEQPVYLSYSGTVLQTTGGEAVEQVDSLLAEYIVVEIPELVTAALKDYGYRIELLCSEAMFQEGDALPAFTLTQGERELELLLVSTSGERVDLELSVVPDTGVDLYLDYSGQQLLNAQGGALEAFEDLLILNDLDYSVHMLPGLVEAEDFAAESGIYLQVCTEGGLNLRSCDAGDFVEYAVEADQAGHYVLHFRYAKEGSAGSFALSSSLSGELSSYDPPVTWSPQTWMSVSDTLLLEEGSQRLRLDFLASGLNLNYIDTEFIIIENVATSSLSRLKIYPNPAVDHLMLEIPGEGPSRVRVVDLAGRVLMEQKLPKGRAAGEAYRLELGLEPGLYQLVLEDSGRVELRLLMIR